jgi:NAD(P)-dependent dehydrogenase (short-subunit alcohol dehydrogenase family)
MRVCIVGASGKLGQYMVQHALDRGYEVVGVCREQSLGSSTSSSGVSRSSSEPRTTPTSSGAPSRGATGCSSCSSRAGSTGTPRERPRRCSTTRLRERASCSRAAGTSPATGRTCTRGSSKALVKIGGPLARLARFADLNDQVEACNRVFASDTRWTVVRGSDLEEGESQGLPVWSRHVGDPILESNITRRVDFAPFHGGDP